MIYSIQACGNKKMLSQFLTWKNLSPFSSQIIIKYHILRHCCHVCPCLCITIKFIFSLIKFSLLMCLFIDRDGVPMDARVELRLDI